MLFRKWRVFNRFRRHRVKSTEEKSSWEFRGKSRYDAIIDTSKRFDGKVRSNNEHPKAHLNIDSHVIYIHHHLPIRNVLPSSPALTMHILMHPLHKTLHLLAPMLMTILMRLTMPMLLGTADNYGASALMLL